MDAGHRSCTVCATNGLNVVSLVITFPAQYPNQAIPSFEFTSDTSIDNSTKIKLMKVSLGENVALNLYLNCIQGKLSSLVFLSLCQTLRETAQTHVKLNQTCLEPCLRQLVSHLEELTVSKSLFPIFDG